MADLPPEYLAANENTIANVPEPASANSIPEDTTTDNTTDEAYPRPSQSSNGIPLVIKGKVTTCAELLALGDNNKCFDCNIEGPLWVNLSYCVFLCAPCATIHAEFGLQVKPLSENSLTVEELALLVKTGNKVAGDYWLAAWDRSDEILSSKATKDTRTKCIIEKYRGKWLPLEQRGWLSSQQHAFCSQPAYYGPTYASFSNANLDSLLTKTQQLSLNPYLNGGEVSGNGYMNGTGYTTDNRYLNGNAHGNWNGYLSGSEYSNGYTHGQTYTNGFTNVPQHSNVYANGQLNGYVNEHSNGNANEHSNGHANEYTTGYVNEYNTGYTNGYSYGNTSQTSNGYEHKTDKAEYTTECATQYATEYANEYANENATEQPKEHAGECENVHTSESANIYAKQSSNGRANGRANRRSSGHSNSHVKTHANSNGNVYSNVVYANVYANGYGYPGCANAYASGHGYLNGYGYGNTVFLLNNGKGIAHSARNDSAPDFVMNNPVAYTKKSRKHRQAH